MFTEFTILNTDDYHRNVLAVNGKTGTAQDAEQAAAQENPNVCINDLVNHFLGRAVDNSHIIGIGDNNHKLQAYAKSGVGIGEAEANDTSVASFANSDIMVLSPGYFQQKHIYTDRGQRVEQKTDTFDKQNGNGGNIKLLYVHEDVMGNTRYHTKDNGQSYAELEYDVWGNPTSPNMLLNNDNGVFIFGVFTGHIYDTVLDIYFAEARFLDAKSRQWMNSDPMKDGLNWYQYVGANPATWVDPWGLTYIIAWSYGSRDIKGNEALNIMGFNEYLGYDKINSTDHWTKDDWREFEKRSVYSRAAQKAKQDLLDMGIPESDIILVRIDNQDQLKEYWREWQELEVVEGFILFSHGTAEGPDVYGGSDDFLLNAPKLNWGSVERLIFVRDIGMVKIKQEPFARFTGCSTGAGEFAQNFANSQNVVTYAPRYASSFSKSPTVRIPVDPWGTGKSVYNVTFTGGRNLYRNGLYTFDEMWGKRFDPQ